MSLQRKFIFCLYFRRVILIEKWYYIEFRRSAEAEQALQKCKEVMTNFSVFEHPLLEKKKATLKELKEQWAGFMETVELPEKGTCLSFILRSFYVNKQNLLIKIPNDVPFHNGCSQGK